MTTRTFVEVICDRCGIESDTTGPSVQAARELANAEGWHCSRGRGDHCPSCKGDARYKV